MKVFNEPADMSASRSSFIETLSDEFIATTGYGVYAYLNPMDINQLFKQYLKHGSSQREFAKVCVKNCMLI